MVFTDLNLATNYCASTIALIVVSPLITKLTPASRMSWHGPQCYGGKVSIMVVASNYALKGTSVEILDSSEPSSGASVPYLGC